MIYYDLNKENWIKHALAEGYHWLLIVKDLEDKDIFPVYFFKEREADKYINNIVSESKLKIIEKINVSCEQAV